jgi:hypothetical protein
MLWATDSIGIEHILSPEAIGTCPPTMWDAQQAEIHTTGYLRSKGYDVDVMLSVYHSNDLRAKAKEKESEESTKVPIEGRKEKNVLYSRGIEHELKKARSSSEEHKLHVAVEAGKIGNSAHSIDHSAEPGGKPDQSQAATILEEISDAEALQESASNGNAEMQAPFNRLRRQDGIEEQPSDKFWYDGCLYGDLLGPGEYFGFDINPFETLFLKTQRGINPEMIQTLSDWVDGAGYESWKYCL